MRDFGTGRPIAFEAAPCILSDASIRRGLKHIGFIEAPVSRSHTRKGFTLLELLVVVAAIGITDSPLPLRPEILPKRLGALLNPTHAKLFTDVGLNWQAIRVGVAYESPYFPKPVIPVPVHRN